MSEEKLKPLRTWIRKKDAQLGQGLEDTMFGPLFFHAEHEKNEVLDTRFCQFLDDDGLTIEDDFIDIGVFKE